MEISTSIIEKIEIQWQVNDETYPYMDTFIFTKEEYEKLTEEGLEQMKINKYNKWKDYMINPNK